jgi:transposase-like protein
MIEVLTVKYLNNIVEQSHRKVKGKMHQCINASMHQCLEWKSWVGAESTLAGVELCSMIKQGQMIGPEDMTVWEQFYSLAA